MSDIDTELLGQYVNMLGAQGLKESMSTFVQLMPGYLKDLESMVHARDSSSVRKQAHKMKGACRSLGFVRLAESMEVIEKDAWQWQEVEHLLEPWAIRMQADAQAAQDWVLAQQLS